MLTKVHNLVNFKAAKTVIGLKSNITFQMFRNFVAQAAVLNGSD